MPTMLRRTCRIFQTALVQLLKDEELVDTITVWAAMEDSVLTINIKVRYSQDIADSMGGLATWTEGKILNDVVLEYVNSYLRYSQALLRDCQWHARVKVAPPGVTKADVEEGRAADPSHPMFRPRRRPHALLFGFALPRTQIHNLATHGRDN
jgi:hypothetical protein